MVDIITIGVLLLIIGGALSYVIKAKKSGAKCIGCSTATSCSQNCNCNQDSII